jgi:Domain of unknown function (DUF4276)
MAAGKNKNSLLFLYEGETEAEFYKKIFDNYIPQRTIQKNYSDLKGVYNLNSKVKRKIESYLLHDNHLTCKHIHVFVAYDREGPRGTETQLDIENLRKEFITESRIKSINEIVATQDLESWFFHDLEGIYKYLKVPKSQRNLTAYNNVEATNNRILSALFHRFDVHYQKGKRVQGFLNQLDIDKIYNNVQELKDSVDYIKTLC